MELKALKTLEFDKIKEKLSEYVVNDDVMEMISVLKPEADYSVAKEKLSETDAALVLMLKYSLPEISRMNNPENSVKRINVGGILSTSELLNIGKILNCADNLRKFHTDKESCLSKYFNELKSHKEIRDEISKIILGENEISDNASGELYAIRKKIKSEEQKIKNTLNDMVRSEHYKKFLQDSIVTVKAGRYVVPVKAEYRNEIPGIVHDISASGGTLFIEPQSSVNANNALSELAINEKREIEKILLELTLNVANIKDDLTENFNIICELEFIFAKAKLARQQKAVMPIMNDKGRINIINGRHPLISPEKVVPENINLGIDFDSLIVTGPNTGGKTVVLKTVGLFTLMAQSGLLVPADDNTELSFFENVFADIGDEQSIEQSLSTFSSHMKNIVGIIDNITPDSLVLFDELGAGTDPTEGAALAGSILEYVRKIGAKTVATTHYSELKLYALSTERVENGSLEFDVETLSPTYRLLIGIPGKSNAFAISKKLGLSDYIIERAKEKISEDNVKFEDVLARIEKDRRIAEEKRFEQESLKSEIDELKAELLKERENFEKKKAKIIEKANEKAAKIIEDTKSETEELLLEMKNLKRQKEEKDTIKAMEELKKELNIKLKKAKSQPKPVQSRKNNANINTLKPGATVLIVDLNDKGTVISINKKDETCVIQMGIMKTVSKISNLVVLEDETPENIKKYMPRKTSEKTITAVKTDVDLRGMNLEEALEETDMFLDRSVLSGIKNVTLIHGKGTGVLRNGIQDMLRHHPHVKSFRNGRFGEGENGVTVVELK